MYNYITPKVERLTMCVCVCVLGGGVKDKDLRIYVKYAWFCTHASPYLNEKCNIVCPKRMKIPNVPY